MQLSAGIAFGAADQTGANVGEECANDVPMKAQPDSNRLTSLRTQSRATFYPRKQLHN
jgi:hypothetical protein